MGQCWSSVPEAFALSSKGGLSACKVPLGSLEVPLRPRAFYIECEGLRVLVQDRVCRHGVESSLGEGLSLVGNLSFAFGGCTHQFPRKNRKAISHQNYIHFLRIVNILF